MEEVVKKIIEIEHKAQDMVSEGLAEKDTIQRNTLEELRIMESNILEMAEHKVEQLKLKSRKEADDKIVKIKEKTSTKLHLMEGNAVKNQKEWEDQIFSRIIGR